MAADNVRFCESGAVTPQIILCEIERYYPAASVVEALPCANCAQCGENAVDNLRRNLTRFDRFFSEIDKNQMKELHHKYFLLIFAP